MAKKPKMQTVKVPDYGDEEINRLAVAQYAIEHMGGARAAPTRAQVV